MTEYLNPADFKQPLYLDVGAGGYSTLEGFTSVDLFTECDIKAPMWEIPLPDGSVKGIGCSNALEHVPKVMVLPTIREWNRLLEVGGRLELLVPDLEWACNWWLNRQTTQWDMDIIFGNQNHPGEFHQTGFNRDILKDYFTESVKDKVTKWYVESIDYLFGAHEVKDLGQNVFQHNVTQRMIVLKANKI